MSCTATDWAFAQTGLKPAAKLVLLYLAKRFNPQYGCFPSQARLAADCQISRASVNNQLNLLEQLGLLRREARIDPLTKRQKSTLYILAFQPEFATLPSTLERGQSSASTGVAEKPRPKRGHADDAKKNQQRQRLCGR